MSKYNLKVIMGDIAETRTVADPWGLGWEFEIARIQTVAYQRWLTEKQKSNPIFKSAQTAMARAALKKSIGGVTDEAELQRTVADEIAASIDDEAVADGFLTSQAEGVAQHLIRGWSGVQLADGSAVGYSFEEAMKLLTEEERLPVGVPFEGQPLGAALTAFLLQQADDFESFRKKQDEEVEGN